MNKHDSILRKQLLDHYGTSAHGVQCITAPHLQLVINSIRKFNKKHISSKTDLYVMLLENHGECSFIFKGSMVKIREDSESTGYDYKFYTEDNDCEHYFQFHDGNIKKTPDETIKYIMEKL